MKYFITLTGLAICLLFCPVIAEEPAIIQSDTSATRMVTLQPAEWSYVPAPINTKLTSRPITISSSNEQGMHRADSIYAFGTTVAIQYQTDMHQAQNRLTRQWSVDRIDLRTGVATGAIPLPADLFAIGFTDDGARAAATGKDVHSANSAKLYIIDFQQNTARIALDFIPYAGEGMNSREIVWSRFVDKDHLLTRNGILNSRVVLWDISNGMAKSIWSAKLPTNFGQNPVLTSDSKYVVMMNVQGICFIEALTGKIAGFINDPVSEEWNAFEYQNLQISVRPDGKFLARSTASHIEIFSLDHTPAHVARIYMPPKVNVQDLVWTTDDYLLVNHKYLVDIKKGMIVWLYSGIGDEGMRSKTVLFPADGRIWMISPDPRIQAFSIPNEQTKNTLANLNLEKVMAVRPGMKVTLDIEIPGEAMANFVRSHFEDELKKNHMTIADNQPVVLRIKLGDFSREKVTYRDMAGINYGRQREATVHTSNLSIAYQVDGNILWDYDISPGAPLLVSIHSGENIDTAIRRDQLEKWRQLQYTHLPEYVASLRDPPGFGQTALDMENIAQNNIPQAPQNRTPAMAIVPDEVHAQASNPMPKSNATTLPTAEQTSGKLDKSFADAIAKVITNKSFLASGIVGGGFARTPFQDIAPAGGVLIGFHYAMSSFGGQPTLKFIQPIYLTAKGEVLGQGYGETSQDTLQIKARMGYAVGAMTIAGGGGMDSIVMGFMRIKGDKLDTDDSYVAEKIGGNGGGTPKLIGGDGTPIIGICGRSTENNSSFGLGLIFLSDTPTATPQKAKPVRPDKNPPLKKDDHVQQAMLLNTFTRPGFAPPTRSTLDSSRHNST